MKIAISIIKFSFLLLISITTTTYAQNNVSIIPQPNHVKTTDKKPFELNSKVSISFSDSSKIVAEQLRDLIYNETKIKLLLEKDNDTAAIQFKEDKSLNKETYELIVTSNKIEIIASGFSGWFYGIQSLRQLIGSDHEIETLIIQDEPRFGWRAYMLDESRYFQGEKFVKQTLDQMALLKMNVFHWHLVDDAGWRIEIKKYPKLTEIGSQRKNSETGTWKSGKTSGEPHGGFYTQEQIKDIVEYAAKRNITIVPEFEMPGHSSAAIAAYSWLGTAGKDIEVPIKFGRHYDNYDVTKPEVEKFVKDVLLELFELFPSEVIHVGGDEVGYKVWDESEHVQKYMQKKGLKTAADLQIYFINNISKFIEENGRRMMGWNEIMGKNIHKGFEEKKDDKEAETELAKNVVIHFWKGSLDLATEAAEKGYGIVNSLHSNTYLDYNYKSIGLEKAYGFDPIPEGLDQKFHGNVYGLGCQMWTEWTPTNDDVEYQTYPRLAAYAEVGWTNLANKNYKSFKIGLIKIQHHWDSLGINYAKVLK